MTKPITEFAWTHNAFSDVVLISGGAGITPLYQLTKHILKDPSEKARLTLVAGVNTEKDLLFKDDFEQLEAKYPDRFKVIYTVTTAPDGSKYRKGRITKELLKEVIPGPQTSGLKIFHCGPDPMTASLVGPKFGFRQGKLGGALLELGYTQEQVYKL